MFSRKKEVKKERKPRSERSLEQYGIFEIPESLDDLGGQIQHDDIGDEELEAELAALTVSDQPRRPARRKPETNPVVNLDNMISESMKDINSDEELSGDENDPDLLDELKIITGTVTEESIDVSDHTNDAVNDTTKLLEERLNMYEIAEKKAKSDNEVSRARRYNRGIITLKRLLSSCRSGNEVDPSEIPPILPASAIGESAPKPTTDETPIPAEPVEATTLPEDSPTSDTSADNPSVDVAESPSVKVDEETLCALQNRQKEYKSAALAWKKSGNLEEALKNIKITKQFDAVITAVLQGNTIDLSDMPTSPLFPSQTSISVNPPEVDKEEIENQKAAAIEPDVLVTTPQLSTSTQSLESALKERLEVYRRSKTVAESEGNSSKVRRYGRICKQFEDALKLYSKGKPIPIDELPTPPGFPSLSDIDKSLGTASKSVPNQPEISEPKPTEPSEPLKPNQTKASIPVAPARINSDKKKKLTSRVDKQIEVLQQRKLELKMAALKAKQDGDLDLARDYLRQAKGIDPLLNVSLAGLPVDMDSIPLSPEAKLQLEESDLAPANASDDSFTMISSMDCSEEASGTDQEIYENLEAQLKKQIKWCLTTRDHCKAIGGVSSYNKWERLAVHYKTDLDMLRVNKRNNLPPPRHHYEIKTYMIVQSCTDLADTDIEISIIRGINYPKEVDSYVIFEFSWPNNNPSSDRTSTIKGTNNPEYDATFPFNGIIDRKSRQCLRVFKRHSLKCQVWSKGGFLRADSLVGTANIKLQPLETKCILHDAFPLMDGRKSVGGKLEVKIRLRNPILTKQIEQNKDKWLTIDH